MEDPLLNTGAWSQVWRTIPACAIASAHGHGEGAVGRASPWYANGTKLYSAGMWAKTPACAAALARTKGLVVTRLRERR
jgi:hypothetical protein